MIGQARAETDGVAAELPVAPKVLAMNCDHAVFTAVASPLLKAFSRFWKSGFFNRLAAPMAVLDAEAVVPVVEVPDVPDEVEDDAMLWRSATRVVIAARAFRKEAVVRSLFP